MRTVLAIFLFFSSFYISAQSFYKREASKPAFSLEVANLTTRSIYGWKTGLAVGVSMGNRMNLSYVNLFELGNGEEGGRTFRGASYQYFFNPKRNFNIGLGLTAGYHNEQFLAVTPSLEMKYIYNERLIAGFGLSRVDRYPKFDFKVAVRLFN